MGRKRTKLKKRTKKMFVKFFGDKENIWVLGPVTIIPSLIDNRLELQIRNGFWRYYHKNGQVAHSGRYNDGVFIGRWKEYDEQGKKIKEKVYI